MSKRKVQKIEKSVWDIARELIAAIPDQSAEIAEALSGILEPEPVDAIVNTSWICPQCDHEHHIGDMGDGDYDEPQECEECGWTVVLQ